MTRHPAYGSVWPRDAIFVLILAASSLEYMLHKLLHTFAILGVHDLEHSVKAHWLRFREAEQRSPFLRYPKFVIPDVPKPQTEVRRVGREAHARFAFPQRGFAGMKLLGQLRRAKQVVAQLIAHRRAHAQIWEADKEGRFDDSPNHQRRHPERQRDERNCAPTHNQSPPPVTTPPDSGRGIHEKDEE